MTSHPSVLVGTSDPKNPDPYYYKVGPSLDRGADNGFPFKDVHAHISMRDDHEKKTLKH